MTFVVSVVFATARTLNVAASRRRRSQGHDRTIYLPRSSWPPTTRGNSRPAPPRPVRDPRLPRALGRSDAADAGRDLGLPAPRRGGRSGTLNVGRDPRGAARGEAHRQSL